MKKLCSLLLTCVCVCSLAQQPVTMVVGTYTGSGSYGIYTLRFDTLSGKAIRTDSINASNPSYLVVAPGGTALYAVSENADALGYGGRVLSYSLNKSAGGMVLTGEQTSLGNNPCYVATDNEGKWLAVGNYSSGNLAIYSLNYNGSIGPLVFNAQHTGRGPDSARQQQAHVHATVFSPNGRHLYVPDLGTDKIYVYAVNNRDQWQPARQPFVGVAAGSGPRHFMFHPAKPYAYLVNELAGTINVYKYRPSGVLTSVQTVSALPLGYNGSAGSADIHLSGDGKFLYGSNRAAANNIAIFAVSNKGRLRLVGHQPTLGKAPRNFCIDPSDKFLLVANQHSDEIVVFRRNPDTGLLTDTGNRIRLKQPVCIQWALP